MKQYQVDRPRSALRSSIAICWRRIKNVKMEYSHRTLENLVRHHCNNVDGPIAFEPIATGKFNTSFWVHAEEREMVLRIAPPRDAVFVFYERDMMRQEPEIHQLVHAQTTVPMAQIIAYDDSVTLLDRDFMLMDRLPGSPLSEMDSVNYDAVLRQVGRYLAETHSIQADSYGYIGAHHPMEPQINWQDAFVVMWNKLIDDVVSVGYYNIDEERLLRGLLEQHLPLFGHDVSASLLHMDVWAQNILVDETGKVTGLIDWDRALWGDPEIEFASFDRSGISKPAFWEGYGMARDWSIEARVRQVFYLLYELQKYIVIRHGRNGEPATARDFKSRTMEIVQRQLLSRA